MASTSGSVRRYSRRRPAYMRLFIELLRRHNERQHKFLPLRVVTNPLTNGLRYGRSRSLSTGRQPQQQQQQQQQLQLQQAQQQQQPQQQQVITKEVEIAEQSGESLTSSKALARPETVEPSSSDRDRNNAGLNSADKPTRNETSVRRGSTLGGMGRKRASDQFNQRSPGPIDEQAMKSHLPPITLRAQYLRSPKIYTRTQVLETTAPPPADANAIQAGLPVNPEAAQTEKSQTQHLSLPSTRASEQFSKLALTLSAQEAKHQQQQQQADQSLQQQRQQQDLRPKPPQPTEQTLNALMRDPLTADTLSPKYPTRLHYDQQTQQLEQEQQQQQQQEILQEQQKLLSPATFTAKTMSVVTQKSLPSSGQTISQQQTKQASLQRLPLLKNSRIPAASARESNAPSLTHTPAAAVGTSLPSPATLHSQPTGQQKLTQQQQGGGGGGGGGTQTSETRGAASAAPTALTSEQQKKISIARAIADQTPNATETLGPGFAIRMPGENSGGQNTGGGGGGGNPDNKFNKRTTLEAVPSDYEHIFHCTSNLADEPAQQQQQQKPQTPKQAQSSPQPPKTPSPGAQKGKGAKAVKARTPQAGKNQNGPKRKPQVKTTRHQADKKKKGFSPSVKKTK